MISPFRFVRGFPQRYADVARETSPILRGMRRTFVLLVLSLAISPLASAAGWKKAYFGAAKPGTDEERLRCEPRSHRLRTEHCGRGRRRRRLPDRLRRKHRQN